ncbi:MAG: polyprenyl synthetase family protein [Wenzhouxiangella sp.]
MDSADWADRCGTLIERANRELESILGAAGDDRLRQAMNYVVFNGGKRLRPLLVYASGEALNIPIEQLDAAACAVELIHCYSLVHDDLPAMDDDDLRRGQPTAHLAFDEATAILAGDALQALAFEALATAPALKHQPAAAVAMLADLTQACGASGMAGGQALDLQMEGTRPNQTAVEHMLALKTGALIQAAVAMPWRLSAKSDPAVRDHLARFADAVGLAFQIRDDLLDIEGDPSVTGKASGADQAHEKASWPALFGVEPARQRIEELAAEATDSLRQVPGNTAGLFWLAKRLIRRTA